jgi:hypothetical protein
MFEKLNRLRGMSNAEVGHRLRERWRQQVDRMRFCCGAGQGDPEFDGLIRRHDSSVRLYLNQGPARRFYSSTQSRDKVAEFVSGRFPEWLDRALQESIRLSAHRVNVLGFNHVALGHCIDWHRDPVAGYQWPRRYWADYDLVSNPQADAKIIHEINRHQHLARLAKTFFLTGDERYAREAVAQMEGWIGQNPKWYGVNWQSSLELAIRSISWMWTIFFLLPSESLEENALRRIVTSLFAQLDHIYRYPSVYTSPNTHLIGEAAALFIGGLVFQELPRAQEWQRFGTITLVNEMRRQVSEDGVYGEASSYYHCHAADFYLQALALARLNRFPFPDWMWPRLEKMFEFVMHISRPDGSLPLIGDDDGGRALALSAEDYSSFRDGLCSGAVLFGRADFKHQAAGFWEETFWLLGEAAWPIFDAVVASHPAQLERSYPESGYFVQRSGWRPEDTHLTFDCGGLGTPVAGHGHADALSFTLFSEGREILIDPATSVYNASREWRTFFRSTQAHNTVVVDGESQSRPGGSFSWAHKATTRLLSHFNLWDFEYVDAEHDGYMDLRNHIMHRRRLIHVRPHYWIVLDDLRGRGEHDFDFLYHFAQDAELFIVGEERKGDIDCRAQIGDAALQLFLYGSGPMRAEAVCGQTNPIQGWASRRYGERHPSPVLRASMRSPAPVSMMTFLVPGNEATHSRRFLGNSKHAIAAVIRDGAYDDIAVTCLEDGQFQLIDCAMRGEFFWMRMENGNLQRLLAVNACSFSYAGETVFESQVPLPYVQVHFWDNGMVIERGEDEGKVYVRDLRDRQFQRY